MKIALLCLLALIVIVVTYWGIIFYLHVRASKVLVKEAVAYQNLSGDYTKTLLVLGDSTGVGVGAARPEDTVAALLAKGMQATYTENLAVSGAVVADVPRQIRNAKLAHYDTILLQIGGNDIIAFHNVNTVSAELSTILATLEKMGGRVILMSAGNVGGATLFPPPIRPFYTSLNLKYHAAFASAATANGATYVNLYLIPSEDVISKHPEIYLAADGLHPSSAGYALWYKKLTETIAP